MIKESDLKVMPLNLPRHLEPNKLLLKALFVSVDPYVRVLASSMKVSDRRTLFVVSRQLIFFRSSDVFVILETMAHTNSRSCLVLLSSWVHS